MSEAHTYMCTKFGHEYVTISYAVKQCEFCGQLKETM